MGKVEKCSRDGTLWVRWLVAWVAMAAPARITSAPITGPCLSAVVPGELVVAVEAGQDTVLSRAPGRVTLVISAISPNTAVAGQPMRHYSWSMIKDTDPCVAARYHDLIGTMSPRSRLAQAARLSAGVRSLAEAGSRRRHPGAGERELRWRLTALCYGELLAERTFGPRPGGPR